MCRIVADVWEQRGGVVDALRETGVEVDVRPLPVGDYDLGEGVLVERKTVTDFHLTLRRGRLWRQIGMLRTTARVAYLLVEGRDLDVGSTAPRATRGALLAVLGQGVPLLFTTDAQDSALWLATLAARLTSPSLGRDRPAYAQRLKPRSDQVREAMLAAVPGISVKTARMLLGQFGSVTRVLEAGYDAWLDIPGVGPHEPVPFATRVPNHSRAARMVGARSRAPPSKQSSEAVLASLARARQSRGTWEDDP